MAFTVYHEFPQDDTVAVGLDHESIVYLRHQTNDIVSIDADTVWVEQGYRDERVGDKKIVSNLRHRRRDSSSNATTSHRRHLQETVPYGISMVQADMLEIGNYPVTVCVVDTGAALYHPDLPRDLLSGMDRNSDDTNEDLLEWSNDVRGHGTHVAGTISASIKNGIGVRGIGKIPLFITRGLDNEGHARESDVLEAIDQCLLSNAKIVSLSLGGKTLSAPFRRKMDHLHDERGVLILAASGNGNGTTPVRYPAAYEKVVAIGAVTQDGTEWKSSNPGPSLEVVAPGDRILSTSVSDNGNSYTYTHYSGTSMATPHVAGVAALVWSWFPECSNLQIRYALSYTAKRVAGRSKCNEKSGHGIVQAHEAYRFLRSHSCVGASWGRSYGSGGCSSIDRFPRD